MSEFEKNAIDRAQREGRWGDVERMEREVAARLAAKGYGR